MSEVLYSGQTKRVIFLLQLSFFLLGLLMLLLGLARIAVEAFPIIESQIPETQAEFVTLPSLLIGIGMALVGYGALYSMAAVGAKEPPAMGAARNSLVGLVLMLWSAAIWMATVDMLYFVAVVILAILVTALAAWLWRRVQTTNLWQVFGQRINRTTGSRFIIWVALGMAVVIMIALGVIYAILNDYIELPVRKPEPGEFLYITTFDDLNEEWDFPQGRQKAEIIDSGIVLSEGSGLPEKGFYAVLKERKFGDFDLRVIAQFVSGDFENPLSVVFREHDPNNNYRFEVSGDGYYRLTSVIEGNAENITPWTPLPEVIHPGMEPNEIRIVGKGDTFQFYINQQLVRLCTRGSAARPDINNDTGECDTNAWQTTWRDETFHQGRIALGVNTIRTTDLSQPVVVRFDNVLIVGPE